MTAAVTSSPTHARSADTAFVAAVLAGMFAIAAQPALSLYHGTLAWQAICGAAVLAIAISLGMLRAPSYLVAPVSLVLLSAYTLVIVALSARAAHVPGGVLNLASDALRGGIARMLGTLLPLEAQPDTLTVPVIAVWIAALTGAEAALRYRRVVAGYAAPVAVYAAAWMFAGPHAPTVWWRPVAFTGLAIAGVIVNIHTRTLIAVAATAALAMAAAPALTASVVAAPADFHRVTPPRDDTLDESPLVRLSGWNLDAKSVLLHAVISGAKPGDAVRLRLAILPDYDGVTWRVNGDYRPAGTVLGQGRGRISARVTIDELDGHLLPAPDDPKRLTGVRAAIDPATGTLMRPEGLAPGLSYTVSASPVTVDSEAAAGADVPSGPGVAEFLELPGSPPAEMLRLAEQIGAENASPYERADGIAAWLRDHYQLTSDAPSGHAYPNLDFFLFAPRNAGGQRGTSEQFAASFAVLGRMLGLPTRVAVGFDATAPASAVRGADAIAWPEVLFDGVGWVAFSPFPTTDEPLRSVEDDFAVKVTPPPAAPSEAPAPSQAPSRPVTSASGTTVASHSGSGSTWWLMALLAVAGTTVALAVAASLRIREERRWTTGTARTRVAHAWWVVHRSLRRAGHRAPPHLDASAVATHASRFADAPLNRLVEVVNSMTFGGEMPTERQVDAAQEQARAYVSALRKARRDRPRRMAALRAGRPLGAALSAAADCGGVQPREQSAMTRRVGRHDTT